MNGYWPTEGSTEIANWSIEVLKTYIYNEYTLRELKLTDSKVVILYSDSICNYGL